MGRWESRGGAVRPGTLHVRKVTEITHHRSQIISAPDISGKARNIVEYR